MSDPIGGISKFGLNYTPISSYNKLMENSLSTMNPDAATDGAVSDFEGILNNQISNMQNQNYSNPLTAGINMDVNNVSDVNNIQSLGGADSSAVGNMAHNISNGFSNGLKSLNEKQVQAENAVETLASGGDISVHDVMIASEKATLNMQMALQLRNKILTAYNELYQIRF